MYIIYENIYLLNHKYALFLIYIYHEKFNYKK